MRAWVTAMFPFLISAKTSSMAWQSLSMPLKSMDADIPLRECAERKISAIASSDAPLSRTRRFFTIFSWFSRDSAI
ncbi:MAG: hypothetical protein A4E38_01639 [Methanoregulaceae archaeon PtaB.Bin108]|nr:MAG: hypothetical protein A4E38_01639 [Methanoregulaceae archaeon PtaB.Bin108]